MEKINNYGLKIEYAREYRHITRTDLAEQIGSTYRNILRWESGERTPKFDTLYEISKALRIPLEYFAKDYAVKDLPKMIGKEMELKNGTD